MPIRVLVVDDSVVVRHRLGTGLGAHQELELHTAATGQLALRKLEQIKPDIITLDVEMPGMNGLEVLSSIRRDGNAVPIIMLSAFTEQGAATTLEALRLGATDYVSKPSNLHSRGHSLGELIRDLTLRILSLCKPVVPETEEPVAGELRPPHKCGIIAIGASTGGPVATSTILADLAGAPIGCPIVIVQHMPRMFTRMFSERLDRDVAYPVVEASDRMALAADTVYIAPGDHHLVLERSGDDVLTRINRRPPRQSCRPSVDTFFESVADSFGPGALGIVLTGMGQDGVDGARAIRQTGGSVLAQDRASSVVWGMPGLVVAQNLAHGVVSLRAMAAAIRQYVRSPMAGIGS